jgi:hypothetical protein
MVGRYDCSRFKLLLPKLCHVMSATENGDENRLKKIEEERELDPVSAIRDLSLTTRASSLASIVDIIVCTSSLLYQQKPKSGHDGNNSHHYHISHSELRTLWQNIPIPPPLLSMQDRLLLQPLMSISRMERRSSSCLSQI